MKASLVVLAVLVIVGFSVAQAVFVASPKWQAELEGPDPKVPKENYSGRYMLVSRYWGSCWNQHGDSVTTSQCWQYQQNYFDTKELAVEELMKQNGPGYAAINADDFVGIYKLVPIVTPDDMKFSEGDRVEKHEVEERTHWFKWEQR